MKNQILIGHCKNRYKTKEAVSLCFETAPFSLISLKSVISVVDSDLGDVVGID